MKHFKNIYFMGKFSGDENDLPMREEHRPGAVRFKEPENMNKLAIVANVLSIVIMATAIILLFARCFTVGKFSGISVWAYILPLGTLYPHEIIHGLCFKGKAYMYTNLKQGMMFVTGGEDFTKTRFIIMSLMPNIVFGFLPYIIFMVNPEWVSLGMFGALCISMGAGDYINVFNAATQMPKGSLCYMHGFGTWWYMPQK